MQLVNILERHNLPKKISSSLNHKKFFIAFINDLRNKISKMISLTVDINNKCRNANIDIPEVQDLLLQIARLNQMINTVLSIYKSESKTINLHVSQVDPAALISKINPRSIVINKTNDCNVETDETQLRRIFENILALHSQEEPIPIKVKIFQNRNLVWIQIEIHKPPDPDIENYKKEISMEFIEDMTMTLGGNFCRNCSLSTSNYIYSISLPKTTSTASA
jgi:hypothetical protein